jgi:hypothetical protein
MVKNGVTSGCMSFGMQKGPRFGVIGIQSGPQR